MRRTLLLVLIAAASIGMRQGAPPGFRINIDTLVEGAAAPGAIARLALRVRR